MKRLPQEIYNRVLVRASEAGWPNCEVMKRGVCTNQGFHWHHRKLRSQGGEHTVENGLYICHACHEYIHAHPKESYEKGWLVKSFGKPETVPVKRRGKFMTL